MRAREGGKEGGREGGGGGLVELGAGRGSWSGSSLGGRREGAGEGRSRGGCGLTEVQQCTSVVRLGLGRQLVNLLQVVKRTNTLQFLNKWRGRQDHGFFGRGL